MGRKFEMLDSRNEMGGTMKKTIFALIIFFGAVTAWSLGHVIPLSGAIAELSPKLVDQCRSVEIAPGTEDITIDDDLGVAFISAGDRRAWFIDGAAQLNEQNGIYTVSLDGSDTVTKVSPDIGEFMPHGISLWQGENGAKRLFAINHNPSGAEIVEIFDVGEGGSLSHARSISFDAMHSPNDVVAVGADQFYATNDRGYEKGPLAFIEQYFAVPFSSVVYFDGNNGAIVKKGFAYANGINRSADGKTIYVAEILKRRVTAFERDASTYLLRNPRRFNAGTAPDNIEVASDGSLWIGGHPKIFDFLKHAEDANEIAPSHVTRINPETGDVSDIFVSLDGEINGSSVGAANEGLLLVGAVFDSHIMICPR